MSGCLLGYIGPGGGFVITQTFLTLLLILGGFCLLLIQLPFLLASRVIFRRRPRCRYAFRKVVVLGLDGLDPRLVKQHMDAGRLPNLSKLAAEGHYSELATVFPALTPAAWSSFSIGNDPSYHGIFDFVHRDPRSYLPKLSSTETREATRAIRFKKHRIPLSRPRVRMLRKGIPFWHALGKNGVEVSVLRMPITFPPQPFQGRLLSGMCVPDLRGSQGTYSLYTTRTTPPPLAAGTVHRIEIKDCVANARIEGPEHPYQSQPKRLSVSLKIRRLTDESIAVYIGGQKAATLSAGQVSHWIPVSFRAGISRIRAIVQFCLIRTKPDFDLYMSPVQLSPEKPAMPLSHPSFFSDYLAKRIGLFGTLGLLEDTSALNEGVISDAMFLSLAWQSFQERKAMFFDLLKQRGDDVTICVFDTPDRIQHMFWRQHAEANTGKTFGESTEITKMLIQMDELVGETIRKLPADCLLLVLSDHGFSDFRRGVNINSWLLKQGYLHLKSENSFGKDWLDGVDWSRTRAYAVGLTGLYINVRGRESCGIVEQGDEYDRLLAELGSRLQVLVDDGDEAGQKRVIQRVLVPGRNMSGPYRGDGPDLLLGYAPGYRCSWECANGQVTPNIFTDNDRKWSGDHCIDPDAVPGVLFANAKLTRPNASIVDLAPTVLDVFGVTSDVLMQGRSLLASAEAN